MIGSPVSSPRTLAAVLRALSAGRQIRKRKLEKADILELSVKYVKSLQNSVQGRERAWGGGREGTWGGGELGGGSELWMLQGQIKEGWMKKKVQGSGQLNEEGSPGHCKRGGSKLPEGVIQVGEGLDPWGDLLVVSPPFSSLPFTLLPSLSLSSPLLSSIRPSFPHFSRPLPFPQGSGRSPAEPSTRRASAAVCQASANFSGAARRAAAARAAPWCTSARVAAPWTAPAPGPRRLRRAAPAPR